MISLIAQVQHSVGGELRGIGPLSNFVFSDINSSVGKFNTIMSMVIGLLTVIAGLYFVFLLFGGALAWLSAGGDKMATENAQKRITHGLIGLVIIIAGIFIIDILGGLLGLDILSPGNYVLNIW